MAFRKGNLHAKCSLGEAWLIKSWEILPFIMRVHENMAGVVDGRSWTHLLVWTWSGKGVLSWGWVEEMLSWWWDEGDHGQHHEIPLSMTQDAPDTHPHTRCLPGVLPGAKKLCGLQDHSTHIHSLLRLSFPKHWTVPEREQLLVAPHVAHASRAWGKGEDPTASPSLRGPICLLHMWMLTAPVHLYLHCWTCNQQEVYLSGDDCRIIFREVISCSAQLQTGKKSCWCRVVDQRSSWSLGCKLSVGWLPLTTLTGDCFLCGEDKFVSKQRAVFSLHKKIWLFLKYFYWNA